MYRICYTPNTPHIPEYHNQPREVLFTTNEAIVTYRRWLGISAFENVTLEQYQDGQWITVNVQEN